MKRAILLVPGFGRHEQLDARDKLIKSLQLYTDGWETDFATPVSDNGINVVTGTATSQTKESTTIELSVFEAYWADLIPDWTDESPISRFQRGTSLIGYWAVGGLVRAAFQRRLPRRTTYGLIFAGLLLTLWYVVVISVLLQALALGDVGKDGVFYSVLQALNAEAIFDDVVEAVAGWSIVVFLVGFMGLGWLERISNVAAFTRAYLMDLVTGDDGLGVQAKAKNRVLQTLSFIYSQEGDEAFDEVYVIGHSLGGAIAIDALAEYESMFEKTVLFTWGSAVGALAEQESLIEDEIAKFYESDVKLKTWVDIVFKSDVMGSVVPVPEKEGNDGNREPYDKIFPDVVVPKLPRGYSMFSGKTHELYYLNQTAMTFLVAPFNDLPTVESST